MALQQIHCNAPRLRYLRRLAHRERTPSGDPGWRGECGARAQRLVTFALGRLGHHPAGTMTGVRGASLDWDRFLFFRRG